VRYGVRNGISDENYVKKQKNGGRISAAVFA
jgi:hypothetical protein